MVQAEDLLVPEQRDVPQALQLLGEMNSNVQQVAGLVDNMLIRVKNGELSTDKGLSFLEMKYQMLLSYLINLTYVVLRKCSGDTIQSDPAIDRLIEIRTVLEKIRPIDSKLKYQIDKLVKTAVTGDGATDDPHNFRANPENLLSKLDESGDSDDNDTKGRSNYKPNTGIYIPPKLAAAHFDETTTRAESDQRQAEKARKRILNSSVIRELREEYTDAPLEVSSGSRIQNTISKSELEKTEYEETYLTRFSETKAEKNRKRKMTTVGTLGEDITNFSSYSGAGGEKKRKNKTKKGKGFKKRRFT